MQHAEMLLQVTSFEIIESTKPIPRYVLQNSRNCEHQEVQTVRTDCKRNLCLFYIGFKTNSCTITPELRATIAQNHEQLNHEGKWILSSGKCVEDTMFAFGKKLHHEQ